MPGGARGLRLELTVEGGFAHLGGSPTRISVERSALPHDDAAALDEMLATADLPSRPPVDVSGMPDVFVYRLRLGGDVEAGPVTFDDVTATPELHALVAWIRAHA